MSVEIDFPVGLRHRSQNVKNQSVDQDRIVELLASIPENQGGKQEEWAVHPLSGGDGNIPKHIADAIFDFQMFWKKKGVLHVADGVVDPGKNTIRHLNQLAAGGSVLPPKPVPPQALPLDIILRFTGGPGGNRPDIERENGLRNALNTDDYLKTHRPIEAICFTGFREQESFVDRAVADVVNRRKETSEGVTIVIGSSAGGVSALKAASLLTEKSIRLDYVGINDAAFFKNEVKTKPDFSIELNTVLGGKPIRAEVKENFFQTIGHGWQKNLGLPPDFVDWTEFHGPLPGFVNVDLAHKPRVLAVQAAFIAASALPPFNLPQRERDAFAKKIHKEAGGTAENLLWPRITSRIKP
jgi:hypothetical protein